LEETSKELNSKLDETLVNNKSYISEIKKYLKEVKLTEDVWKIGFVKNQELGIRNQESRG
jgi:hypothetical protein